MSNASGLRLRLFGRTNLPTLLAKSRNDGQH
jgi:hypothetical protein